MTTTDCRPGATPLAGWRRPPWEGGRDRFKYGWFLAGIWLLFLQDPVIVLLRRPAGWAQVLGLVAVAAFVVLYMGALVRGRHGPQYGPPFPLAVRVGLVGGLAALLGLMIPGAGGHALTAAPYVAVLAVLNLPIRAAIAVAALIAVATDVAARTVPGWTYEGYAVGVALASVAVFGMRMAIERSLRLVVAQDQLAELAVENERARIAQDLHDILGHSLTVVTIKAELAQRLLDTDPERARAELRDLEALSRDALADVRATALGVRGVSLPGEIAAARSAFAAAGIEADLPTAADDVPSRSRDLFAWTIREAATNLVRHSGATRCTITLTPTSVEITDDGAGEPPGERPDGGRGLDGLRRRAEARGARLTAGNRDDGPGFRVRMEALS